MSCGVVYMKPYSGYYTEHRDTQSIGVHSSSVEYSRTGQYSLYIANVLV